MLPVQTIQMSIKDCRPISWTRSTHSQGCQGVNGPKHFEWGLPSDEQKAPVVLDSNWVFVIYILNQTRYEKQLLKHTLPYVCTTRTITALMAPSFSHIALCQDWVVLFTTLNNWTILVRKTQKDHKCDGWITVINWNVGKRQAHEGASYTE